MLDTTPANINSPPPLPETTPPPVTTSVTPSRSRWVSGIVITAIGGPFGLLYLMWKRTQWPLLTKVGLTIITSFIMLIGIWGIVTPQGRAMLLKGSGLSQKSDSTSNPLLNPTNKNSQSLPPEWQIDTDQDGLPDKLEIAYGSDPNISEDLVCQKQACGDPEGVEVSEKKLNTLIILDASGSMAQTVPGGVKMDIAKEVLNEHVPQLPQNSNVALMIYGHKGSNFEKDKQLSCSSIELIYPLSPPDAAAFSAAVSPIKATGWTAIGGALAKAREVFMGHEGEVNQVLVISDGIETCDSDPVARARELKDAGITTKINVVGFGVSSADANVLKQIADAGGGTYYTAENAEKLREFSKDLLEELSSIGKIQTCEMSNYGDYEACMYRTYIINSLPYLYKNYQRLGLLLREEVKINSQVIHKYSELTKAYREKFFVRIGELRQQVQEQVRERLEQEGLFISPKPIN